MFDVAFSELIVIGIVALVVIGPERLPKVARTVGHLLGRLQRYVGNVKADISREMQLDELKQLQTQVQESARNFEDSIKSGIRQTEESLGKTLDEVGNTPALPPPSADAADTPTSAASKETHP